MIKKTILAKEIISLLVWLVFIFLFVAFIFWFPEKEGFYGDRTHKYETFNYCVSIAISLFILWIAFSKLGKIAEETKASFLLEVAKLWRSECNLEARKIIHELVLQYDSSDLCKNVVVEKIGKQIIEIKKDKNKVKEFIYILCLLDFCETVGYLVSIEYLNISDVNELCGGSIIFYYNIFSPLINYLKNEVRNKRDADELFKWFKYIHDEIGKKKND